MANYQSDLPPRSERHPANKKTKQKNKKDSFGRDFFSTVIYIVVLFLVFFVVHRFFYAPVMVDGDSMETTLSDGDYLILNKYSDIERFDIVVFPPPDEEEETLYIKRVIGLPGDKIEYKDDLLYLNGEEIEEDYLDYSLDEQMYYSSGNFSLLTALGEEEVPEGEYFVLGDNRLNSRDSRSFGFVDQETILGKVSLRYWPLDDFEVMKHNIKVK